VLVLVVALVLDFLDPPPSVGQTEDEDEDDDEDEQKPRPAISPPSGARLAPKSALDTSPGNPYTPRVVGRPRRWRG